MDRTLISFSLVSSLWARYNKDYLDIFVPFIATLLYKHTITEIKEDQIKILRDYFYKEFGLNIPHHPMVSLLNKSKKFGLLKRERGFFRTDMKTAESLDFSKDETIFLSKKNKLINSYIHFALKKYNLNISIEIASDIFLGLLKDHDIDILFASNNQSIIPQINYTEKNNQYTYVLYRFTLYILGNEPELYDYFNEIAFGHIISSTILLENIGIKNETVSGCKLFLDTPIILYLIGVNGDEYSVVYQEYLKNLRDNNAKLSIFRHNYEEVNEALENSITWVNKPDFDPRKASRATLSFRQQGFDEFKIKNILLQLDDILTKNEICIEEKPVYLENKRHQIDEQSLTNIIETMYKERDSTFDKTLHTRRIGRDVDSIAAIYRLRKKNIPKHLKRAKYCFVTTNSSLALANVKYNKKHSISKYELLACLTDVFVGTILWINSPKIAKLEYRDKFLADCYHSIKPDAVLEKKLLYEAKELLNSNKIIEKDYLLLTTSYLSSDLLSEVTLGDPNAFTGKTPLEVLEKIKEDIKREEKEKHIKTKKELEKSRVKINEIQKDNKRKDIALELLIHEKSHKKAIFSNIRHGLLIFLPIVLPIPFSILFSPFVLIVSVIATTISAYYSFKKGFTFKKNYSLKYKIHFNKYKDEYFRKEIDKKNN